jgi:uncharacterized protein involved in response to NO
VNQVQRSLPMRGAVPEPGVRPRHPISAKGFRPFFLFAAVFASLIVPVWLLVMSGVLREDAYLVPLVWHAHEMVFGFATAVLAGFLLTAVGNWTQRETLVGPPLMGLACLWAAGRLAMLLAGALPRAVPAVVDLAFLPALALALARPLIAARNGRNFVMLAVIGALFVANLDVHLDALGIAFRGSGRHACLVAVDILVLLILVIAGRVFPMFTRNATGDETVRSSRLLDISSVLGMGALTVVDVVTPDGVVAAVASGAVGVLAGARAWGWRSRRVLSHPLLWILHLGYAWVPAGLLLRAASAWTTIPGSAATHALTAGAIGSLTLGMMARVALGHTGRPLVAPRGMSIAFAAVTMAAVVRVVLPLVLRGPYYAELVLSGAMWTAAFLIFVAVYAPILSRPRIDGKAG